MFWLFVCCWHIVLYVDDVCSKDRLGSSCIFSGFCHFHNLRFWLPSVEISHFKVGYFWYPFGRYSWMRILNASLDSLSAPSLMKEAMMMMLVRMRMAIYNVLPLHLDGGGQLVQGHHGRLALHLLLAALLLTLDHVTCYLINSVIILYFLWVACLLKHCMNRSNFRLFFKLDSNFLPPYSWPYTGTQPFDLALAVADWEDVAHHKDVVRLEDVAYRKDIGHQEDVVLRQEDAIIYSLCPFPDNQTPFHTLEGLRQFQSFSGTYASSPSSKY